MLQIKVTFAVLSLSLPLIGCGNPHETNSEPHAVQSSPIEESPAVTNIEKPQFSFSLSGDWIERPSQDGFDFVNDSLGEQVLVSILDAKQTLDRAQLGDAVDRLVEIRRRSVGQLSGGSAKLTETENLSISGGVGARFTGVDTANNVQFAVEIRGFPHRVVTVSYYRYRLDDSDDFRKQVDTVMGSLAISGS